MALLASLLQKEGPVKEVFQVVMDFQECLANLGCQANQGFKG